MKISENWLREWVSPNIDSAALQEQLTLLGLEVDGCEKSPCFDRVVVCEVVSVSPHPAADKLRICSVDVGAQAPLSVVCGAPNVVEGMKVPLALVGATLPDGIKIKKSSLRGVTSFGMLCSARELALFDDAIGLMALSKDAPVGVAMADYLALDDTVIDIDLTPNRGDCLSIRGIARDIAARNRLPLNTVGVRPVASSCDATFPVEIISGVGCPRYAGRVIQNIDPTASTPLWMQEKLRRCGVRAISPVVDVTNYVMLELGQPMHGFDCDKLHQKIVVRDSLADECIELLDGRHITLDEGTMVITDARGVIAIAGVMGGKLTAVSSTTQNVFFESAMFLPEKIAGKPRRYNAHTDSAYRYERHIDPQGQVAAIERATQLLLDMAGGEPGPVIETEDATLAYQPTVIMLPRDRIQQLLGVSLGDNDIVDILSHLGLDLTVMADGWCVQVPSYRPDISLLEDLVEEIARIYGYDRIPRTHPPQLALMAARDETCVNIDTIKNVLLERGYQEAITYSFVSDTLQRAIYPESEAVMLANPISSDLGAMRLSLWPGLLGALQRNLNHQQNDVKLFESGLTFVQQGDKLVQDSWLSAVVSGRRRTGHWQDAPRAVDFFDIKGDVEALFDTANAVRITFEASPHSALHPGQSAKIICQGEPVGYLGMLHPQLQQSLSIAQPVFLFEINQASLLRRSLVAFKGFSKFPSIRRDIALLIDEKVTSSAVLSCVRQSVSKSLENIKIFDVYTGEGIDNGLKSMGLELILNGFNRTLTDQEVDKIIEKTITRLKREFGATLRT